MTALVNNSLKVPYEIGVFIASQVPHLDSDHGGHPWAQHKGQFKHGPNPFFHQMKQGLLLEVTTDSDIPSSIYTRYGVWIVLGSSGGFFHKIFEVIQKTLKLKKLKSFQTSTIPIMRFKAGMEKILKNLFKLMKELVNLSHTKQQ